MKRTKKIRCIVWTLLFAATACTPCFSLDNARKIEWFTHTSWGKREGAPQQISDISQTKDGYLWLATPKGLYRFDGITFELYQPQAGPQIPTSSAECLLEVPNGDLWIGFSSGEITRLRDGRATNYSGRDGLPEGPIRSLAQDGDGTIWAGTLSDLVRLKGNQWERIGKEWNFFGKSARGLFVDRKGTLWVAPEKGPIFFLPAGATTFQSTSVVTGQTAQIAEAPNGKLWIAEISRSVRPIPLGTGLQPPDSTEIRVGSQRILFSREGDLWITTVGDGLRHAPDPEQVRGKPGRFSSAVESFTAKNGLTDNYVLSIFEDHNGNIWVGTLSGLDRFQTGGFVPTAVPGWDAGAKLVPGNQDDLWVFIYTGIYHVDQSGTKNLASPGGHPVLAAYREPNGVLWLISAEPALIRAENGHFSRLPMPAELPRPFTGSVRMTEDGAGVLWISVYLQGLFRRDQGTWSRVDTPAEISKMLPITAFTDSRGRAWFGYAGGTVIYLEDGKIHPVFTRESSLVHGVGVIGGRTHMWIGGSTGLLWFDGDQFHRVIPTDRPDFDHVYAIEESVDGSLWLCDQEGIIRITAPELRRFLETPSYRVRYDIFDPLGSVPGLFEHSGARLVEGADGRIWFGGDHGLAWLSPAMIPKNVRPPLWIGSMTSAGRQYAIQPDLTLPPRNENLQIKYTAADLSAPEQVRYRYKLDGQDKSWQDVGTRREAFYTNLGPGKYRFHMNVRNVGGDWNPEEAVLDFRIAPAWFQTIWFRASCVCAFLLLLWLLYQLRLRQLQRQFNRTLETRVSERTRIARDLHDTLLQSFSALLLRLQSASNLIPARPDEAQQRVESAIEQASNAITEGRDAVHQLRSGELLTSDLAGSISNFFAELPEGPEGEDRPQLRVQVEGTPREIHPMVRDEAFRIAAEALRNAVRYAEARHIEVEIRYDEQQLRLRIRDNGRGINPDVLDQGHAPGHWGLRGMRERARLVGGNFEVWSEAGSGTEVELTIPAARAWAKPASRWSAFFRNRRS